MQSVEGTHLRVVHEALQPTGRIHIGEVNRELLWEEPQAGAE